MPEFDLLLHSVRFHLCKDTGFSGLRECLSRGVRWPVVLQLSQQQGVTPLLLRSLRETCWSSIPEAERARLEHIGASNARRNTILAFETARVMSELRGNGISAATFKGPVLAESVYGDLSLRKFADIDVIVRHSDLSRTEHLLASFGYHTPSQQESQREYFAATGQHPFRDPVTGMNIDLHWQLAPFGSAFPFPLEDIWPELQEVPLAGHFVPTLAWEHLAMFLAFHGTKERWRFLKWVCDFAFLIRARPELDFRAILERARQYHCARPLLLASLLASDLLSVDADPDLLIEARADATVVALARESREKMTRQAPDSDLTEFLYSLKALERIRDKIALTASLSTTLTLSDYSSVSLPRRLRRLHYLARPFRLAWKAGRLLRERAKSRIG